MKLSKKVKDLMTVDAYQTLEDRGDVDKVENEGPFQCTRKNAWLGYGYYFWDSNVNWGIAWGQNSYIKLGKEFIIGMCKVDLSNNCFDLFGTVADQLEFSRIVKVFKESKKVPEDQLTVPNIIHFMKINEIFPYFSIRACDYSDPARFYYFSNQPEFTLMNQRVQICVIHKRNVILQPFKVIYPEKYI